MTRGSVSRRSSRRAALLAGIAAVPATWTAAAGAGSPALADPGGLWAHTWNWTVYGDTIGNGGFLLADIDGDGGEELVSSGGTQGWLEERYWYVLERGGDGLRQTWSSALLPDPIGGIALAPAPAARHLAVLTRGEVRVHDGATRELLRTVAVGAQDPTGLALVDLDADANLEMVVLDLDALSIHDWTTGELERAMPGFGGEALDVGQADADPALEIVVGNGSLFGFVMDGASFEVEWGRNQGFGTRVLFAQLDADAPQELVTGWFHHLRAFDPESRLELWTESAPLLGAFTAFDLNGSGPEEVIYGEGDTGGVHVLDAAGIERWVAGSTEASVSAMAVGDVDLDGQREIYLGATGGVTAPTDRIAALDLSRRIVDWRSCDFRGPVYALARADLDGDGAPELLTGTHRSEGGNQEGVAMAFEVRSHAPRGAGERLPSERGDGLWRVRAGNLDADPQDEFCMADNPDYQGRVACFDGRTWAAHWIARLPVGETARSLEIADLDGDGALEVAAGSRREWNGAGAYLYAYSGATGEPKWRSPELEGAWEVSHLRVGELDEDAAREIAALARGLGPLVLDGATGAIESGPWSVDASALEVADLDEEPLDELYVAEAASVSRVDLEDGSADPVIPLPGWTGSLRAADVDRDGEPELLVVRYGRIEAYGLAGGEPIWTSETLAEEAGTEDALLVADLDGDEWPDLAVGTSLGFTVFATVPAEVPLFDDGFETEGLGAWSVSTGG